MGAGKTTVGKALAKALGLPFYDLDWYIETRMRRTVKQIFDESGEEGFRRIEHNMLHLGGEGKLGEYGIVRNHSYQVTIQNIKGFGTPVYDPKKEIDPMIPSDENTYLAASIKVLSWRVVSSKVDLDQTK